eukprot:6934732-Pyramimonas_sp.AAC.1
MGISTVARSSSKVEHPKALDMSSIEVTLEIPCSRSPQSSASWHTKAPSRFRPGRCQCSRSGMMSETPRASWA